jgi:hypothetical protein
MNLTTQQEEKIYENPADESRAPELWLNSALWLKVEKLLSVQAASLTKFQEYIRELAMDDKEFFREVPGQLRSIQSLVDEELIRPTTNLTDLVSSTTIPH